MPLRPQKSLVLVALATLLASLALGALYAFERRGETSPVAAGKQLIESNGCYACHGRGAGDERINFRRSASGSVRPRSLPTFWENGIDEADVVKEWVREGHPADERERHQRLLVQMPAYGGRFLSEAEIDAVAAWILAQGLALTSGMGNGDLPRFDSDANGIQDMDAKRLFVLGDRISRQQGCYQCHGELGQGGVSNPAAFKEYIPGFWGRDFHALTKGADREEILHWIDHGRGRSIERGPLGWLARRYFDRQAIPMPAYKDLLSESEKAILVDYLLLLNRKGALDAADVQQVAGILSDQALHEPPASSE